MDKLDFCLDIVAFVRILDLMADLAFLFMELLVGVAISVGSPPRPCLDDL